MLSTSSQDNTGQTLTLLTWLIRSKRDSQATLIRPRSPSILLSAPSIVVYRLNLGIPILSNQRLLSTTSRVSILTLVDLVARAPLNSWLRVTISSSEQLAPEDVLMKKSETFKRQESTVLFIETAVFQGLKVFSTRITTSPFLRVSWNKLSKNTELRVLTLSDRQRASWKSTETS